MQCLQCVCKNYCFYAINPVPQKFCIQGANKSKYIFMIYIKKLGSLLKILFSKIDELGSHSIQKDILLMKNNILWLCNNGMYMDHVKQEHDV